MTETSFHFVNNNGSAGDQAGRKLMRRHVMKGKNTGKTLSRASRLQLTGRREATPNGNGVLMRNENHSTDRSWPSERQRYVPTPVARSAGNGYVAFAFPIKITKTELDIMNNWFEHIMVRLYPAPLGLSLEDAKLSWLQILCSDEATCRCNFALIQAGNEIFLGDFGDPRKAAYCLSKSLREVKKRIESNDALADSTITIVLSLIMQEQMRGEYASAEVHMGGLRKMVELRGGLRQLDLNPLLVLKIGKTDVVSSLHSGGPTMFYRDNMADVRITLATQRFHFDRSSAGSAMRTSGLDGPLRLILFDAMGLSSLLNEVSRNCQLASWTFQEIELSICYRLLNYRPLDCTTPVSDVSAAYYIGLVIFISTLCLQYDCRRMINFPLVSQYAKSFLTQRIDQLEQSLALWLATMAGIWVSADVENGWMIEVLGKAANRSRVETYDEAFRYLTEFPWIRVIHDKGARSLWDIVFPDKDAR